MRRNLSLPNLEEWYCCENRIIQSTVGTILWYQICMYPRGPDLITQVFNTKVCILAPGIQLKAIYILRNDFFEGWEFSVLISRQFLLASITVIYLFFPIQIFARVSSVKKNYLLKFIDCDKLSCFIDYFYRLITFFGEKKTFWTENCDGSSL